MYRVHMLEAGKEQVICTYTWKVIDDKIVLIRECRKVIVR
mgnify:CR=1 FL=1